ncbi:hypothetical protein LYSHEL_12770 [Lysobacter helvus]|uniref:Carboxypeptidase regulatory-like domain-containing protein n=2 Tax=Lysobacteraceae TaxID=32033 RepID=A0ABN6FRI3_9GAMM|nr:hypothetical protein LYSCAS_12770 [Lysobacter caseinilyticus]BCT95406.1 hypothetical protein LYSHEL_12770 [Lysobacter helvus]
MRGCVAIFGVTVALAGCGGGTPAPVPAPAPATTTPAESAANTANDATRAWLARALTCGDRAFLTISQAEQRERLRQADGVTCTPESDNTALRCAVVPALRIGNADIGWFVLGAAHSGVAPVILPAPPDALRNAMPAGAGELASGTDLGDTRVECALTEGALAPGAIAGVVTHPGDPEASVRVCAFELNDGVATCTRTARGERAYRIEGLSRGDYVVLAIPGEAPDARIGYTDCVAHDGGDDDTKDRGDLPCTHELRIVAVPAGKTVDAIDPADLRTLEAAASWPQPPPTE